MKLHAQEVFFKSGRERLCFRAWEAPVSRATVMLLHGIGEHSGRHARLGAALREAGFSTVAFDMRGHGRSSGRRAHVRSFGDYVDDLAVFCRVVEDQGRPGPRFLLGHSLGGLVTIHYLLRDHPEDVAGVVLSSPALKLRVKPSPAKMQLARLLAWMLPGLRVPNDIYPSHLTHDRRIAKEYARDPLVEHGTTPRTFMETLHAMAEALVRAPEVTRPLLVLGGTDDPVVLPQAMRDFVERVSSPVKRLILYNKLYHEVFHEIERERVVADLVGWMEARL